MKKETIKNILNFLKEKEGKKLPYMWVRGIRVEELIQEFENHPDGAQYRYEGDLDLGYSNIRKLPNDLYVGGFLSLSNCSQLTKLPNKLYVDGFLSLSNCTELTILPNDLHVETDLDLRGCIQITELPNNLYVGDSLYLIGCEQITELPDNLHLDVLNLDGTNITELPNNLYVNLLSITGSLLAKKYTDDEIYEIIESTGGKIPERIYR